MSQEKKSNVGDPIYVESLMTDREYAECSRLYPEMFSKGSAPKPYFKSEYDWRYRMGEKLRPEEIQLINKRLAEIKKKVGLQPILACLDK